MNAHEEVMDQYYIDKAISILHDRMRGLKLRMACSNDVTKYLMLKLSKLEHECFGVLFTDTKNRLIEDRVMFRGTLANVMVYPREIAKEALALNAAKAVLYHNHPSGDPTPGQADIDLTSWVKDSLALIDVEVIDHVIVAGGRHYSFNDNGRL